MFSELYDLIISTIICNSHDKDDSKDDEPPSKKKPTTTPLATPTPNEVSPFQKEVIANKKYEAEAKLWAKKLGAGSLGGSWMIVLGEEFKKKYFSKVRSLVWKG